MSRYNGKLFSVMFMARNVVGLIRKFGNPAKIVRKGSRKPRWADERVWRRRR